MDPIVGTGVADPGAPVDVARLRAEQRTRCRELLEGIEEIRAAESALAARRLRLVAQLAGTYPAVIDFLRNEIAPALNITDVEAHQMVERAQALTLALPETFAALASGRIGEAQAIAVADAVCDTTPEVAAKVDRFAVAAMAREPLTDRQVYRRAHRQVLKLDPPAADRRHRDAKQSRGLARRLSPDGMATLRMYATAEDVAAVWDACTVLADAAETPDDQRTLDGRRVDALVDLVTGVLDTGRLPAGSDPFASSAPGGDTPADTDAARSPEPGSEDAGSADTRCDHSGVDDWAAWTAELGEAGWPADWNWRVTEICWETANTAADRADPAAVADFADFADTDVITCGPSAVGDSAMRSVAETGGWVRRFNDQLAEHLAAATATICRRRTAAPNRAGSGPADVGLGAGDHPAPAAPPNPLQRRRSRRPRPSVLMNVTVPIDLLLGDPSAVAEIPGIGPITAGQVAALLDHATLRRILCDPISGEVLNIGRTRYTPTAAIARHVKTRDQTCIVPGCDQPAARCDIDHRLPYSKGGDTAAHNLQVLCRHHHRAKDGGGFHLSRTDTGWEWTTALGRTYRRPVTRLYEPGDNYWPLNIRQRDGYDPYQPADPEPAPPPTETEPVTDPVSDLPDDPPF